MNTEITDNSNVKGWIVFDARCRLCVTLAHRLAPLLGRYRFGLLPLQERWVMEKLGRSEEDLLSEMRLLTAEGVLYGGADALMAIAREIWWAKPLYWIAALPFVKPALRGRLWLCRTPPVLFRMDLRPSPKVFRRARGAELWPKRGIPEKAQDSCVFRHALNLCSNLPNSSK